MSTNYEKSDRGEHFKLTSEPRGEHLKSGFVNTAYASGPLGGIPEKRDKDQIAKANSPKRSPDSILRGN